MSKPCCLKAEGAVFMVPHIIKTSQQDWNVIRVTLHKMFDSSFREHETPIVIAEASIQPMLHKPPPSAVTLPSKLRSKGADVNKSTLVNISSKDISLS
jgi:hypothetical protein